MYALKPAWLKTNIVPYQNSEEHSAAYLHTQQYFWHLQFQRRTVCEDTVYTPAGPQCLGMSPLGRTHTCH